METVVEDGRVSRKSWIVVVRVSISVGMVCVKVVEYNMEWLEWSSECEPIV